MATGDQNDMLARLEGLIPSWYSDNSPVVTGILNGVAFCLAYVYGWINFAKMQTRIKTASGSFLDMIALDFFGLSLQRQPGQSDAQFLSNIQINLFQERGTRRAVSQILTNLTGRPPGIFEPQRPADTGAYGGGGIGYGVAGGYGSLSLPYQAFVTAYRPISSGIPYVGGYGSSVAAYRTPSQCEYGNIGMIKTPVTDAQIYQAIDSVKCEGTIVWARIAANPLNQSGPPLLDTTFILDVSQLS
jgi:hypothetical protein